MSDGVVEDQISGLLSLSFPYVQRSVLPLIGKRVSITVPQQFDIADLEPSGGKVRITSQAFTGEFSGMASLLINETHSTCFSDMFVYEESEPEENQEDDDAINEFVNITTNAIVSFIDNKLNLDHDYELPVSKSGVAPDILKTTLQAKQHEVCFICQISFHNLIKINADLVFSFTMESYQKFSELAKFAANPPKTRTA